MGEISQYLLTTQNPFQKFWENFQVKRPKYDSRFIDFLKRYETFRPEAYWDSVGKKWTIGYGTTVYADGTPVKEGDKISKEDAEKAIGTYLDQHEETIKSYFPNWDNFYPQLKYAILNNAYRGGPDNFKLKSPKFTAAINKAMEDGQMDTDEYQQIINEMEFKPSENHRNNLYDRRSRVAAMIGELYNWNHNNSINYATTHESPYMNFSDSVFTKGSTWNNRLVDVQNLHQPQSDMDKRVRDKNPYQFMVGGMLARNRERIVELKFNK